jgi:hypothetical protein
MLLDNAGFGPTTSDVLLTTTRLLSEGYGDAANATMESFERVYGPPPLRI